MKQFFTTLILMIFSFLITAQTLKEFDLQEISEQQIPLFVDHPNEAAYIFYTAINGLTVVSSTGGVVSSQQEATKLTIFLRPERQVLTIKAPGFIEKKIAVESVSAKQAKFFRLNPKEEKYVSEKGSYLISTVPDGCLLKIEGNPDFKQFTPFELKDYEARKYKISISKPGFYPLDTLIEIRPEMRQSSLYKIRSQFGILSIKAPLNVTVKINNQPVEVGQEYVNQKLKDGVYTLDVIDSRFETYHEKVGVGSGETKLLELPLVKRVGVLQIDHSDAFEISVNGTTYTKKEGVQLLEFFEGSYQAKIKRSGFAPVELSFTIQKGKVVNWAPVFKPILVQVKLITKPEGASVVLIRNGEKKVLGFTPIDEQIAAGEVEFLLSSDGVKEYKFKDTLEEGKALTKKIDLANPKSNELILNDIDGNIYHTVTIGTQVWMVENLKTTKYRNGDLISYVTDGSEWKYLINGAYSNYNNDTNNALNYGRLYNWYVLNDSRNIAPTGWHVATDADWTTLTSFLGGTNIAGKKLKSETSWNSNGNGSDDFGFSAFPGGYRNKNGVFEFIDSFGYWWSSTENNSSYAWSRSIYCDSNDYYRNNSIKNSGFSVRCVKD